MLFYRHLLSISTSNNYGYGVRATTIDGQRAFAPTLYFAYVSRDRWSKAREIRLRVLEEPNARDQIALNAFHSFLVEVQTNGGYIYATHA